MTTAGRSAVLPVVANRGRNDIVASLWTTIAPELVPEQTALAPLLLQTEGFVVDVLTRVLGRPVRVEILKQGLERVGLIRQAVLRTDDLPLYLAVTVVRRQPGTVKLIRTMRRYPTLPFGEALKKHRMFHHRADVSVRRTTCLPNYQALFGAEASATVWERTFAVVTPRGKKIAGVTEIFSPKLEVLLQESAARSPVQAPAPATSASSPNA